MRKDNRNENLTKWSEYYLVEYIGLLKESV